MSWGGGSGEAGGLGGCGSVVVPKEVPPGFVAYTGYSCSCRFYVPGPSAKPLDPVEWEACSQPGPLGVACQRMKTTWSAATLALRIFPKFWFDREGNKAYLQFARTRIGDSSNILRNSIVADVDGPLLASIVEHGLGCTLTESGVQGSRYLFGALGSSNTGPITGTEGAISGKFGEAPDFAISQTLEDNNHTGWGMTSEWLVRWKSGLHGRKFGSTAEVSIFDPSEDVEGLPPQNVQGVGSTVLFGVGSGTSSGVMVWTESKGARALVRYPGDATKAAGNFGTDGVDMVWTFGEGTFASGKFSSASITTAPFTTDPALAQKSARRLRSDPGPLVPGGFAVGCGYAARELDSLVPAPGSKDLLVVRLSDGVSWLVKMPSIATGAGFIDPLGITCDEVFSTAQFPDDAVSIVRIRLDSLGPGTPPD